VAHALEQKAAHHEQALEYNAAITDARRAIAAGRPERGRAPLARAQALSPFDTEVMALWALLAELDGRGDDAGRGYRAALALRNEETAPPPDPHEGLARLAAYGGARPVAALSPERASQPIWLVADPVAELRSGAPAPVAGPVVALVPLGLTAEGPAVLFFRDGGGPRAFALLAGALRPEVSAAALAKIGTGPLVASATAASVVDLARIEELRAQAGRESS
jgi:hypothetical protein